MQELGSTIEAFEMVRFFLDLSEARSLLYRRSFLQLKAHLASFYSILKALQDYQYIVPDFREFSELSLMTHTF